MERTPSLSLNVVTGKEPGFARSSRAPQSALIVAAFLLGLVLESAQQVSAQRLAIRHYDVSDGLAHGQVTAVLQDRKGYIWVGTFEGLSRFDGYGFTNYSAQDGLGHVLVTDLAEDGYGRLWVATNGGGVARLIDDPKRGVCQSRLNERSSSTTK